MTFELTGDHTCYIYDRGAQQRLFQLYDTTQIKYQRLRDATSVASVDIAADKLDAQHADLAKIRAMRHELVCYRGKQRMWEGPVTLVPSTSGGFHLDAKDVTYYWNRTIMRKGYSSAYPNTEYVTSRLMRIARAELARKEALGYNLLNWLVEHHYSTDARTSAVTDPSQMYLFTHLDELAQRAGIDYTTIGRQVHIWDTSRAVFGQTRTVTENDFIGDITVTEYGAEVATHNTVTDGQGGVATVGKNDPYYGEIELLYTAYDETTGGPLPTKAELLSQAQRNSYGRLPAPVIINVPSSTQLNPRGTFTIEDLVPGRYVPVLAQLNVRQISQMQKIQQVDWTIDSNGEQITANLVPSSKADDDTAVDE